MTKAEQMKAYKAEGRTNREVASKFGVSEYWARCVCKGIASQEPRNTEEDVARKIKLKTGGAFEYISGYVNKNSTVLIKCMKCGGSFERTFHHITTARCACPICKEIKQGKEIEQKNIREQKRKAKQLSNTKQIRVVSCKRCGQPVITYNDRVKYCSDDCRKKQTNAHGSDDRLNKKNIIDRDITLKKLYERDNGVCKLCGGRCDYDDWNYKENGTFVAGNNYPSIDHITPLSAGGKHEWNNIRLAHRICNVKAFKTQLNTPSRSE